MRSAEIVSHLFEIVWYDDEWIISGWREGAVLVMTIHVRAQGQLRHLRPDGQERFTLALPPGSTVRALIDGSGVPWDEVGLVAVNGRQADDEQVLADGDEVTLLAPMEGG